MLTIHEKQPNGKQSIKAALEWIKAKEQRAGNATVLWTSIEPEIKQSLKHEFSDSNPNMWSKLSPQYLKEKVDAGYPSTIGVRTGSLKVAVTDKANVRKGATRLQWLLDENIVNSEGNRVGDYAYDFHMGRTIFKSTRQFINRILKSAVKAWLSGK